MKYILALTILSLVFQGCSKCLECETSPICVSVTPCPPYYITYCKEDIPKDFYKELKRNSHCKVKR
jgi:hypothetical protein